MDIMLQAILRTGKRKLLIFLNTQEQMRKHDCTYLKQLNKTKLEAIIKMVRFNRVSN
jgi:hypothetical protein